MPRPRTDKRDRLVTAAAECFHRHGFASTSLAEVAKAAGLVPGNVFYYFKTKDELALAVVDEWVDRLSRYMALFETDDSRWLRLERFVDQAVVLSDMYVTLGCPLAGLTRDLGRAGPDLRDAVPRVYAVQYGWLSAQFRELGFASNDANGQTRILMAGFHGAILLAYTQRDPGLIASGVKDLKDWLRRLRLAAPCHNTPTSASA
jgi:AcrR family transcriptional regulator